ncbi:MAG TPA: LysR family transcriptional regulator [Polyangiaceae bacterium]|nr:LysR family transcriptional regulator [Polyangiaceae bacterium]
MEASRLPEDINLLVALEVLLRERHVTRAARRLGLTQSAMSQRLARLRAFFGDPLLVPGRGALALTPRADAMAEPLARALGDLRAAVQAGAPFDPSAADRTFLLLGNDLLEAIGLPGLAAAVRREAPGVRLTVERLDADFAARLAGGTADLAFAPDFMIPSSLRRRPLSLAPFVVLARRGHPAARGPLTLERYLAYDHLLVAPRGAPGGVVDAALEALGRRRRVSVRVQHFVTAPLLLPDTDLLLTCPEGAADFACSLLPLRRLAPPLELPPDRTSMVWHERVQHDSGHAWLRAHLDQLQRAEPARQATRSTARAGRVRRSTAKGS